MKKLVIASSITLLLFVSALGRPVSAMAGGGSVPPTSVPQNTSPTCTLSANPDVLAQPGNASTLSWTTTGASSFSISPVGDAPTSGSLAVTPAFTTYYTGTATGPGGTAICAATIEVRAWNLVGDWFLLLEKGSATDADGGGRIDDFPFSSITLPLKIQQGLLYEGGEHLYQGVLPGYNGSWAYIWFTPHIRPDHQKYVEISIGIPVASPGENVVTGTYTISCKLFLERTSESWGWGVMTAGYYQEDRETLVPGATEVPDKLFISTCRTRRVV